MIDELLISNGEETPAETAAKTVKWRSKIMDFSQHIMISIITVSIVSLASVIWEISTQGHEFEHRISVVELATAQNTRDISELKSLTAQTLTAVQGVQKSIDQYAQRSTEVDSRTIEALHMTNANLQQQINGLTSAIIGKNHK